MIGEGLGRILAGSGQIAPRKGGPYVNGQTVPTRTRQCDRTWVLIGATFAEVPTGRAAMGDNALAHPGLSFCSLTHLVNHWSTVQRG